MNQMVQTTARSLPDAEPAPRSDLAFGTTFLGGHPMLLTMRKRVCAAGAGLALALALAFAVIQSAAATSTSLSASGCSGSGASNFAQYQGWAYTTSSCYYRYLYTTTFQSGGGYHDFTPTWDTIDLYAIETDPTTNYIYSSHNVCTAGYASCNGYVNTSASR